MQKHGMDKDLDGRKANNVIRRIVLDLIDRHRIEVIFWNGNKYRLRGLTVNDPEYDFSTLPFEIELEYYDTSAATLFSDLVVVRRIDGTKTYWRGFDMKT
ncbi:MAG TPA: hypothetical protein DEB39_13300 [Planctomycetaceae bacterium]|nr:hypothetical protein [Planctomycetaceae bacterium]